MKHLIGINATVLDALKKISEIGMDSLTLFAVDSSNHIVGTLTDGDIRRALINGATTSSLIDGIVYKSFIYLKADAYDIRQLHDAREKGITLLPVIDEQWQIVDIIDLKKQKSYLPIDAILMAGGKGERLRPLTETVPKPLLKVGNKAIIDHNVDRLISYGIKNITVTVNYLGEQLEKHYEQPRNAVHVKTVRESKYLGTIGGTQSIEELSHDTVLIMNSDIFTNIDFEEFYLHFIEHQADVSAAAVPYSVSVPFGVFDLEGEYIEGIKEKPTYNYFVNAGIYLVKKDVLNMIPKNQSYDATDWIEDCVQSGRKVVRFPLIGYWYDIGTKEDFQKVLNWADYLI